MDLEACLPPGLRGPGTAFTRMSAGWSGAGVWRVDAGDRSCVLKVSPREEPADAWQRRVAVQRAAGEAAVAPAILHVDEERRAVVSELVVDRSFPMYLMNPATRERALADLGRTLARVHALPVDAAVAADPIGLLRRLEAALDGFPVPGFVGDALRARRDEVPPDVGRPLVLAHNDVNPTNLAWDGERVLLLDWDTAGRNDPLYDLAAAAVFFRLDGETCRRLFDAYDGHPEAASDARFAYCRRMVATLCGAAFLGLARKGGHPGGDGSLATTPSLGDVYQRLRTGQLSASTPDGQWAFGLALVASEAR